MGTLVDSENCLPHLLAHMAELSVCGSIMPDGGKTTSGVSSSVYPLTAMVTIYLAPVITEGSLTHWKEDYLSGLVGSSENSTCKRISYSGHPALHELPSLS